MFKARIKAVIFDMDGVITNSMPLHFRIWRQIFAEEGIRLSKIQIYEREGQKGLESIREIFAVHGKPFSVSYGNRLLAKKEAAFKTRSSTKYISGSRAFLRKLKQSGVLLGLVTGTSRKEVIAILPKTLLDVFDVVVSGSDVKKGKPHPEPYLKALQALRIGPKEAIVIENAPLGIASAKAAGIYCLALKTSLPAAYLKKADKIFNDYIALEKTLCSLV